MDSLLQQGINAAKAGDKVRAFQLLTRATQESATAEQAWLWLAGAVTTDAERLFCLDNALRVNPNNVPAKNKAAEFRQKGIFPAVPTSPYPPSPAANPPAQTATSQPAASAPVVSPPPYAPSTAAKPLVQSVTPQPSAPSPAISMDLKPLPSTMDQLPRAGASSQQDLSGFFRFAAQELARKQSPKAVVQKLTAQGVSPATANQIVTDAEKVFKKVRAEKSRKQMIRGMLWAIAGIVLTCGTLALSSKTGGGYILFYGAIIFGVIDFVAGLIGWLSNR